MLFLPLLQILPFALLGVGRRQPQSPSYQTSIGPLQALTLGSFISSLHSSEGTYVAMEIILEATQALFLFVPQLTPTERTEWTRRGETCCSVAFGLTPGQLESGRKLDRNINSYVHTEWRTLGFVSSKITTLLTLVKRSLWRGTRLSFFSGWAGVLPVELALCGKWGPLPLIHCHWPETHLLHWFYWHYLNNCFW